MGGPRVDSGRAETTPEDLGPGPADAAPADSNPADSGLADSGTAPVRDATEDVPTDLPLDAAPPRVECPSSAPEQVHQGDITASETWDCTRTHVLMGEGIYVRNGAVLTLQPGTVVKGGSNRAALVVTTAGRIDARGTAAQPVVFTSARPVGSRAQNDWGGVVLLGLAPINFTNTQADGGTGGMPGTAQIEGIVPTEGRARYGGTDPAHNCGVLKYVRIEFSGFELSPNNELNGLTVGGCGSATVLEDIQVHRAGDDGVEMFGGTVDLRRVLVTLAEDDGLDWDFGWTGRVQFLVVQSPRTSTESDPNGIEADNEPRVFGATPLSNPLIYNGTLLGPGTMHALTVRMNGGVYRRGTAGRLYNMVVANYPNSAADVRDAPTVAFARESPPRFHLSNSVFHGNGMGGMQWVDPTDNDLGFDEAAFFMAPERQNRAVDPLLPAWREDAPSFVPAAGSPLSTGAATPPSDGFFVPVSYLGAVAPGAATTWMDGWTAFPSN